MPALMISNYDVTDRDALNRYRAAAGPILVGPDLATPIAISDHTVDLGEGVDAGSDTVGSWRPKTEAATSRRSAGVPGHRQCKGRTLLSSPTSRR